MANNNFSHRKRPVTAIFSFFTCGGGGGFVLNRPHVVDVLTQLPSDLLDQPPAGFMLFRLNSTQTLFASQRSVYVTNVFGFTAFFCLGPAVADMSDLRLFGDDALRG